MKIKSLHIDSYRHLQNLVFDFTYPEGHATKSGQLLEKICIIGQSASGKTSVLELVKESISKLDSARILENKKDYLDSYPLNFKGQINYLIENSLVSIVDNKLIKDGDELQRITNGGGAVTDFVERGLRLIYFSSDFVSKKTIEFLNKNPIDLSTDFSIEKYSRWLSGPENFNYIVEFVENFNKDLWYAILYKILDFRKKFTQLASELINKGTIGNADKLSNSFIKWSASNPHPLTEFSNFFSPIGNKLNVAIDIIDTQFTIPVKSQITDEVIPFNGLSTGTKSLLLSMFPLYELDTNNAIILMDEPERSLFPDIQLDLIDTYKNLAPNTQIIVTTHSPFIAAAFEPEERFILYFNEEGNVAVRRGESPIGDDPNDMLTNDFNVDYYNEFGKSAYKKYLHLKQKLTNEKELDKKKDLLVEMTELGNKYNF